MISIVFLAEVTDGDLIGSDRWSGNGSFGLLLVTLILFIGLGLCVYFLNRQGGVRLRSQAQNLDVLETRALGGRQFLMVAAYGEERFLLSVCPGRVEYLCPLPPIEGADEELPVSSAAKGKGFSAIMDLVSAAPKKKNKICED